MQVNKEIIMEAKRHGINNRILRELMKEYRKIKRKNPKNFAELIEGAVC